MNDFSIDVDVIPVAMDLPHVTFPKVLVTYQKSQRATYIYFWDIDGL
ncbi:hypothetical protein [Flagellimonas allohymeniacidonis]|nr:hypothetical protein [Allomuricauda hymeniacidonis]